MEDGDLEDRILEEFTDTLRDSDSVSNRSINVILDDVGRDFGDDETLLQELTQADEA